MPSLVEIGQEVLEKIFFLKVVDVFQLSESLLFRLEKGCGPLLEKKNSFSQEFVIISPWKRAGPSFEQT